MSVWSLYGFAVGIVLFGLLRVLLEMFVSRLRGSPRYGDDAPMRLSNLWSRRRREAA